MKFTRRSFLGLLGGAIAVTAVAEWPILQTLAPVKPVSTLATIQEIMFFDAPVATRTSISRYGAAEPLMVFGVPRQSVYRWFAPLNHELWIPEGVPSLVIDAPAVDWKIVWRDSEGKPFLTSSDGSVQSLTA